MPNYPADSEWIDPDCVEIPAEIPVLTEMNEAWRLSSREITGFLGECLAVLPTGVLSI
jgi:hypothetical protein